MSKYKYEGYGVIRDTEIDFPYHTDDIAELLEEKDQQITDLQSQLAEKEKEISNLRGLVNERDKQIKNLKTNKKRVIEHKNNVKISFAVEQLEKVKEKALHFYVNDTPKLTGFYVDVNEIENQIKRLTHQHEDKGE